MGGAARPRHLARRNDPARGAQLVRLLPHHPLELLGVQALGPVGEGLLRVVVHLDEQAIRARGGQPFMEYQLPESVLKLKQGFGRLIRTKRDRGTVVILDPRVRTN